MTLISRVTYNEAKAGTEWDKHTESDPYSNWTPDALFPIMSVFSAPVSGTLLDEFKFDY